MRPIILSALAGLAWAGTANAEICSFRIDNPGHGSVSSSSQRIDSRTVEHTTATTIGRGARGAGTLVLNSDGSYEVRGYAGLGAVRKGRWIANDEGPFSDKGGIELLDVKGPDYGEDQRSWFVYAGDDGGLVGREPPYTGFNDLRFTRTSGGAGCARLAENAVSPAQPATTRAASSPLVGGTPAGAPAKTPAFTRLWHHREFLSRYLGKTRAEIAAEFGKPQDMSGYKAPWTYNGFAAIRDTDDPKIVNHSAVFSFTEAEGGEVYHIAFR
jgi:hypothetical protein